MSIMFGNTDLNKEPMSLLDVQVAIVACRWETEDEFTTFLTEEKMVIGEGNRAMSEDLFDRTIQRIRDKHGESIGERVESDGQSWNETYECTKREPQPEGKQIMKILAKQYGKNLTQSVATLWPNLAKFEYAFRVKIDNEDDKKIFYSWCKTQAIYWENEEAPLVEGLGPYFYVELLDDEWCLTHGPEQIYYRNDPAFEWDLAKDEVINPCPYLTRNFKVKCQSIKEQNDFIKWCIINRLKWVDGTPVDFDDEMDYKCFSVTRNTVRKLTDLIMSELPEKNLSRPEYRDYELHVKKIALYKDMLQWCAIQDPEWVPDWGDDSQRKWYVTITEGVNWCTIYNNAVHGITFRDQGTATAFLTHFKDRLEVYNK